MAIQCSERLYGLDHLRSLAIILVLMYHYRAFKHPDWIDHIGQFGWTGVDLFFVLSGFLISSQLFKEMEDKGNLHLKTFYIKRFFRIIPPFLFTLFLYFTFPFFRERESLPPFWKFITFTQNYGLDVIHKGTFSHAWSLCIEEQFYLFLPMLLWMLRKVKMFQYMVVFTLGIIFLSLIIRTIEWNELMKIPGRNSLDFWKLWYMKIYYPTHSRLDGLGVGILTGYVMQYSSGIKKSIHRNGNILFLAGLTLLGISFWMCREQASKEASTFGFILVAVSYGIIVLAAVSESSFLYRWKSSVTLQLAGFSYAIYLSHKGIIHMVQDLLESFNFQTSGNGSLLLSLLACVVGAVFYRWVIEKPVEKIKYRILRDENKVFPKKIN
ncbi:acyltransferase family protein [Chryseobacterium gallinarum]|uniref:Acyltransferase n=1 Tax=Chryseobacterium gallinarum TaxID=1324352 RepID=A0ABX6KN50_CHRGL|nr:acyltransferase [Chryseobacterium gallinarum]QIY89471.1 acyltransferase [Chryseobacterium gallinarum]